MKYSLKTTWGGKKKVYFMQGNQFYFGISKSFLMINSQK